MKPEIEYLKQFALPRRWELFQEIIQNRTRYITVVLEDLYQPHNASAVLRTSEAFGVQDVHIIENRNTFEVNREIAVGASKWLTLHRYNRKENNTLEAIEILRKQGYRIVATTPHKNDVELDEFDLGKGKAAIFFGSELPGLSDLVLDNADEYVKIDMYGFTESFNISVSAALVMHTLIRKLHNSDINWQLTEEEKEEILFDWLKKSVKDSDKILKRYAEERQAADK